MKKSIIFLMLLVNLSVFSQEGISGIVTYKIESNFEIKSDTIENSLLKKVFESLLSNGKQTDHLLFKLKFNSKRTVFLKDNTLSSNKNGINPIEIELKIRGKIFSELSTKINLTKINSAKILVRDSLNFNWKLTKETKTIAGYLCYKATGIKRIFKRNTYLEKPIIAWYSPELNILAGPSGYRKLPGLILELNEVGLLTFKVSEIEFNNDIKIEKVPNYKIYDRKEYDQILRERRLGNN
ncbi:MAG: GLPGLI family protein [Bacteroidetes bacterium]|nr:GLPGLI family protein [Bacteroidota bacterium]